MFTGHSLGAGTAVLLTLLVLNGGALDWVPGGTRVRCVGFAPPPVYRPSEGGGGHIREEHKAVSNTDSQTICFLEQLVFGKLLFLSFLFFPFFLWGQEHVTSPF